MRSQDAVITRVAQFPERIDLLMEIESNLPKFIVRNR